MKNIAKEFMNRLLITSEATDKEIKDLSDKNSKDSSKKVANRIKKRIIKLQPGYKDILI